jgi:hypothetical protein
MLAINAACPIPGRAPFPAVHAGAGELAGCVDDKRPCVRCRAEGTPRAEEPLPPHPQSSSRRGIIASITRSSGVGEGGRKAVQPMQRAASHNPQRGWRRGDGILWRHGQSMPMHQHTTQVRKGSFPAGADAGDSSTRANPYKRLHAGLLVLRRGLQGSALSGRC